MPELIGDNCEPSTLIVPVRTTEVLISGSIVMSGSKLWFGDDNGIPKLVTSA